MPQFLKFQFSYLLVWPIEFRVFPMLPTVSDRRMKLDPFYPALRVKGREASQQLELQNLSRFSGIVFQDSNCSSTRKGRETVY